MWLRQVIPTPALCMQHVKRMQVTRRGLRQLLALPTLVELSVHPFTGGVDDTDDDFAEINYERDEELEAMLDDLDALSAQHGRKFNSGLRWRWHSV